MWNLQVYLFKIRCLRLHWPKMEKWVPYVALELKLTQMVTTKTGMKWEVQRQNIWQGKSRQTLVLNLKNPQQSVMPIVSGKTFMTAHINRQKLGP